MCTHAMECMSGFFFGFIEWDNAKVVPNIYWIPTLCIGCFLPLVVYKEEIPPYGYMVSIESDVFLCAPSRMDV